MGTTTNVTMRTELTDRKDAIVMREMRSTRLQRTMVGENFSIFVRMGLKAVNPTLPQKRETIVTERIRIVLFAHRFPVLRLTLPTTRWLKGVKVSLFKRT